MRKESYFLTMPIYIRLYTDFWSHRKTLKLKSHIGTDAYWVPPRLWSYAADHQTDGDFSNYSSEMLCDILGCSKHAPSMLQALHESGFMADGKLNDWEEHNKFHAVNSDRARKAANARHEKERNKKEAKNKEIRETETEQAMLKHAPSRIEPKTNKEMVMKVVERWNSTTLPKCLEVNEKRVAQAKLRLSEEFFSLNWEAAIERIKVSDFCHGKGATGWRANIDWFLKPGSVARILEGAYDNKDQFKNESNKPKPISSSEFLKDLKKQ